MENLGSFTATGDDGNRYVIDVLAARKQVATRGGTTSCYGLKRLRVGNDQVVPLADGTYELTVDPILRQKVILRPDDPAALKRAIDRAS